MYYYLAELVTVDSGENLSRRLSPVPVLRSEQLEEETFLHSDSSDPEPFQDSGDEYVPTDSVEDSDENPEEQFGLGNKGLGKIEQSVEFTENSLGKPRRGRQKVNEGEATRKRKRNPSNWTRTVRKSLKTAGKEYTSVSGNKTIPAKKVKAACTCRKRCFEKITFKERQTLFTSFYKLSSSAQNQFIANSIEEEEKHVQRLRRDDGKESRRNFTRHYFLTRTDGKKIEVCQVMFLNTFDVTLKKARVVVEKKRSSGSKICSEDKRGKHENHPKVPEDDKLLIKEHINLFPAYQSHYSRSHTQKKYLSPDLSIAKMHRLYMDYCKERTVKPRNESLYRKIFVEEFNVSFHKPKNDTCAKCDKFAMQLKCCENETQRIAIEEEKTKHLNLSESAYESKRRDKEECRNDPGYVVISFDLQKCLPTPYLRSGVSFYKRQLWTFNLTIYQTRGKESSALCYLWNETIAGRGGQEIGSCIYHYLHHLSDNNKTIHTITMYSDSCGGQNRNIYFSTMLLQTVSELQAKGRNLTINHKFLEAGHTHMEADTIHAAIEKTKKRTTAEIELPRDWANLIRLVPRKPPIKVIEMEQDEFLNFKSILNTHYVHRKKNTSNESIQWLQIKWMQYSTGTENILYKHSFEGDFKILDISRSHKNTRQRILPKLQPLNNEPLPLSTDKLNDLKALLPYISKTNRMYYNQFIEQLTANDNIVDYMPEELAEEEGDLTQ